MANAVDFIGSVYNALSKTFNIGSGSPDVFMQMAWPGYAIGPVDFKMPDAPNGPYNPAVAEETFSGLCNMAPIFNKTSFENSGFEIDDLYEIVLSSAIPAGATENTVATNPLYKLFSDALFEFAGFRRGSPTDPNGFYYPCTATPSNWYDEAASQFWPTLTLQSDEVKPAAPNDPIVQKGGTNLATKAVFKMKPNLAEATLKANLNNTLTNRNLQVQQKFTPIFMANTVPRPLNQNFTAATGTSATSIPANDVALRSNNFATRLSTARASTLFTKKSVPTNTYTQVNAATIQKLAINNDRAAFRPTLGIPASRLILLQGLLNQQLPEKPVSPTTNGYSISFKYCRVNIDRPWLKLALLNMRNWYMFSTPANQYSTGSADNNPGMFSLLPTSFIVIRDLKITANWSQDDKNNIANSVAFGPFDIRNATLNQNTLEAKGMQVISWISKVMPALPPLAG